MQKPFEVGDVVNLKSASQKMTVANVYDNGDVELVWMVYGTAIVQRATLPAATLKKHEASSDYVRY